jgi:hypothetical protein
VLPVTAADNLAWVRWRDSTAATALRVAADVMMSPHSVLECRAVSVVFSGDADGVSDPHS